MRAPEGPFRPSRHGFRFANRFAAPVLALALRAVGLPATWGLCGGMVRAARDAYRRGRPLTERSAPPPPGTALYRRLLREQIGTFGPPPFFPQVRRFARWTRCSDAALARRTRKEQRKARRLLARGRLVPLGLIYVRSVARLWENHQVLAYAADGDVLRIYDPNEPGRDDVALASHAHRADGPAFRKCLDAQAARAVRGFFVIDAEA